MGVSLTILNDTPTSLDVQIQLKGGYVLSRTIIRPNGSWNKTDNGLAASCPYDLLVKQRRKGQRARGLIR